MGEINAMTTAATRTTAQIEMIITLLNFLLTGFIYQSIMRVADKGDNLCFEKCYITLERSYMIHTFGVLSRKQKWQDGSPDNTEMNYLTIAGYKDIFPEETLENSE